MSLPRPARGGSAEPAPAARPAPKGYRLILLIDAGDYDVRPLPLETGDDARAFRLTKPDAITAYDVIQDDHGHSCDCPDFLFRKEGRTEAGAPALCKHIKALIACGVLDAGRPTPEAWRPAGKTHAAYVAHTGHDPRAKIGGGR